MTARETRWIWGTKKIKQTAPDVGFWSIGQSRENRRQVLIS